MAHLLPVSLLEATPHDQRTHLVLSELVLSDFRYLQFYADKLQRGDTVILDNPVHEDRKITVEQWLEAVALLQPTVAVIPDVIDSGLMTLDNAREAVAKFGEYQIRSQCQTELMAVPHGESQVDWFICALSLSKILPITWFGISLERRLNDDPLAVARRRERVQMMSRHREFMRLKLHLLGLSEGIVELSGSFVWLRAVSADVSKFAIWYLAESPVYPPPPVTIPYPGRTELFGGSYEYFLADCDGVDIPDLRDHLTLWTDYAEGRY